MKKDKIQSLKINSDFSVLEYAMINGKDYLGTERFLCHI